MRWAVRPVVFAYWLGRRVARLQVGPMSRGPDAAASPSALHQGPSHPRREVPSCLVARSPQHHQSGSGGGWLLAAAALAAVVALKAVLVVAAFVAAHLWLILTPPAVLAAAVVAWIAVRRGWHAASSGCPPFRAGPWLRHVPRAVWAAARWHHLTRNLGLAAPNRHSKGKMLRPRAIVHPGRHGVVARVRTVPGSGRAEFDEAAEHIAQLLAVSAACRSRSRSRAACSSAG